MVFILLLLLAAPVLFANPHGVKKPEPLVVVQQKIDPFARIEIKSNAATCTKEVTSKDAATLTYVGNVLVTLADGSYLKTEKLIVTLNTADIVAKKTKPVVGVQSTSKKSLPIKTMQCLGNVFVKFQNRTMQAQKALCDIVTGNCTLQGSVVMTQQAEKKSDVPVTTKSSMVLINLKTGTVHLKGSEQQQVCTVIELGTVLKKDKKIMQQKT